MGSRTGLRRLAGPLVWTAWLASLAVCGLLFYRRAHGAGAEARSFVIALTVASFVLVCIYLARVTLAGTARPKSWEPEPNPARLAFTEFLDAVDCVVIGLPAFGLLVGLVLAGLIWPWFGPWSLDAGGFLGFMKKIACSGIGSVAGGVVGFIGFGVLITVPTRFLRLPLLAFGLAYEPEVPSSGEDGDSDRMAKELLGIALLPVGLVLVLCNPKSRWIEGGP